MRITKSRPYRMTRRAEQVDRTRREITAAAARLHTTIGPANTTIAGIAEEAGVTRLTVYRHFADQDELFEACRAHWFAEHPPPDTDAWADEPDDAARARRAFREQYAWFRSHGEELFPIYRDFDSMPASSQERVQAHIDGLARIVVLGGAGDGSTGRGTALAVARHLLDYRTWRSLAVGQGLTDRELVEVALRMLTSMADATAPPPDHRP